MENIVIGCYDGFNSIKTNKGGLYVFLKSLRNYNKECKIIIICNKNKIYHELIKCCQYFNVELFKFDLNDYDFSNSHRLPNPVQHGRYIIFSKILKNYHNINKVLLSDANDVIFQGDPFSIYFHTKFYCALEQNLLTDDKNSSSLVNKNWIMPFYNYDINKVNNLYKNKFVICCGTILGYYNNIMEYLEFFNNNRHINDQGIFNIYINDFCDSKTLLKYQESEIITLDKINYDLIKKDENNFLLNNNGKKYVIIHQIDRCGLNNLNSMIKTIFI